jgi:Dolichyl-phosphate-mannose-protein mannosyltransferase
MLILAFALCAGLGYLAIACVWPDKTPGLMVGVSLTPGFGLGIFSMVFWLMRLYGAPHLIIVDASLLVLLGLTYSVQRARAVQRFPNVSAKASDSLDIDAPRWLARILTASFVIATIAALYHAALRVIAHPHGEGWDAFAIWNLHARFLFLGAVHWRDGFNALIPWSHPDYPLLIPAAIAHLWSYVGHDDPPVPAIVGFIFTFSTLALLVSSLASLRGRNAAMLGGLALSSTPFFIEQGTSQYADVPLSFFILASLVLLNVTEGHNTESLRPVMLSGLAAGFAAWTKNEGLLFLSALIAAQAWAIFSSPRRQTSSHESAGNWRRLASFVLGAAPVLVLIAWFKHTIATPGDLFSTPYVMIQKILTPSRWWTILQWFAKEFLRFGNWWIIPATMAILAFCVLTLPTRKRGSSPVLHISALALCVTLAGYFAIYLITPRDLYWHLRFALSRLFLQLWPGSIFLFFLFVGGQRGRYFKSSRV